MSRSRRERKQRLKEGKQLVGDVKTGVLYQYLIDIYDTRKWLKEEATKPEGQTEEFWLTKQSMCLDYIERMEIAIKTELKKRGAPIK